MTQRADTVIGAPMQNATDSLNFPFNFFAAAFLGAFATAKSTARRCRSPAALPC
jgi:hypothetical protein